MASTRRDFLYLSNRQKRRRILAGEFVQSKPPSTNSTETCQPCSSLIDESHVSSSSDSDSSDSIDFSNEFEYFKDTELNENTIKAPAGSSLIVAQDSFENDLRVCFAKHHASQNLINDMLSILRKQGHKTLPVDARTLMRTPRNRNEFIISIKPGNYIHFGIAESLKHTILNSNCEVPKTISLNINVDGLPIAKSSGSQLWPILGDVVGLSAEPFIIGIYHGFSKPENCNEYLRQFVEEYLSLERNSVMVGNRTYSLRLNCFIADAPAKAFIKDTKGHNAYYGCSKCTCHGKFLDKVVFLDTSASLRTDTSFRNRFDTEHHKRQEPTILESLNIDMIKQFPLDYMHLVLLGVMKKLLSLWVKGNMQVRLKKTQILQLEDLHLKTTKNIPSEFSRKPRSIFDIDRWKATEFRLFLLYIGPVVLKYILSKEAYRHFLSLSVAIRIFCDKKSSIQNIEYGQSLLMYFVQKYKVLYGKENVTYNVHNLIHLVDDVKIHGPLDAFSAFKFENYMSQLKKLLKNSRHPLQQIANRIKEKWSLPLANMNERNPILRSNGKITTLNFENFKITSKDKDACVMLKDKRVIKVHSFFEHENKIICHGSQFNNKLSFFDCPCDSTYVDIFLVSIDNVTDVEFEMNLIDKKCVLVPVNGEHIVISLLH